VVLDPPVKLRSFNVLLAWHERAAGSSLLQWVKAQLKAVLRQ
jgi:hypothetical protein